MVVTKKIKYILTGIGICILLSLYYVYNPIETFFFPKCPFHSITGLHCAGCGSQRALHELLRLNILKALDYNALYLLAAITISYNFIINTINKYAVKKYYNYIYHPKTPLIVGVIVVAFWILRNIDIYPFTVLAP